MNPQASITEAQRRQYSDNFDQVFQQEQDILSGMLRGEEQQATWKAWDYIGQSGVVVNRARNSQTQHSNIKFARRWNMNDSYTWSPNLIDPLDVFELLKDPQSAMLKSGMSAINRAKTQAILQKAFAQVLIGNDAPGTTGDIATVNYYDPGECIVMNSDGSMANAVGDNGQTAATADSTAGEETTKTATGLTLAKVQALALSMDNASVPATDRIIVANADNKQLLLSAQATTNSLYNVVKTLPDGEIGRFLGFTFVWLPTQMFGINAVEQAAGKAAYTTECIDCLAFQKSALLRTDGKGLTTRITEESTANFNVQLWAETTFGALRLQGPGVAKIVLLAHPTPTLGSIGA